MARNKCCEIDITICNTKLINVTNKMFDQMREYLTIQIVIRQINYHYVLLLLKRCILV